MFVTCVVRLVVPSVQGWIRLTGLFVVRVCLIILQNCYSSLPVVRESGRCSGVSLREPLLAGTGAVSTLDSRVAKVEMVVLSVVLRLCCRWALTMSGGLATRKWVRKFRLDVRGLVTSGCVVTGRVTRRTVSSWLGHLAVLLLE